MLVAGLAVSLAVLAVALVLPERAWAEDTYSTEYSVLYGGNFSDADAHRFSYRLYYAGPNGTWVGKTQSSYFTGNSDDVNHWDVTNGWSGVDPWPGANDRDILYLSTHGTQNLMAFYDPSYQNDSDREEDQNGNPDNCGPDTGYGGGYSSETVRWEIGSDWIGTNRTNSRWDNDIEWIFLASCNQLSADYDSRVRYARTLLGDPQRAHAIWGYDYLAPGDGTDVSIVDDLFDYEEAGTSTRYAWLKANDNWNSTNACGIVHAAMQYEGLPPISPLDSDSPVGSTPDIHYWYIPSWTYSQQSVEADSSGRIVTALTDLLDGLGTLFRVDAVFAAEPPSTLHGRNTTYNVKASVPEVTAELDLLTVTNAPESPQAIAGRVFGASGVAVGDRSLNGSTVFQDGSRTLIVHENGRYQVLEGFEPTDPVAMTRDEAIALAEQYIRRIDSFPADAAVMSVRGIACADMDVDTGAMGAEVVQAYIVDFGHEYDGVPIRGCLGDKLSVVVSSSGVCEYMRNWHEVEPASGASNQTIISANDALAVVATDGEGLLGLPGEVDITDVELVYYSRAKGARQTVMFPAWRIGLDGVSVYVNAVTGRPMSD